MATKKKAGKKFKVGGKFASINADGSRPLTTAEKKYLKDNKIGLLLSIKKGEKFAFRVGKKIVMTIDTSGVTYHS